MVSGASEGYTADNEVCAGERGVSGTSEGSTVDNVKCVDGDRVTFLLLQ